MREYNDPPTIEVLQALTAGSLFSSLDNLRKGVKKKVIERERERERAKEKLTGIEIKEKTEKSVSRLDNLRMAVRRWYTLGLFANESIPGEITITNWQKYLYIYPDDKNPDNRPNQVSGCLCTKNIKDILFDSEVDRETKWSEFKQSLISDYWGKNIPNSTNEEKKYLSALKLVAKSEYLSTLDSVHTKEKYLSVLELVAKSEYLEALELVQPFDVPDRMLVIELEKLTDALPPKEKTQYIPALELVVILEYLAALELVQPLHVGGKTTLADFNELTTLPKTSEYKYLNTLGNKTFQLSDRFPSIINNNQSVVKEKSLIPLKDTYCLNGDFISFAYMFAEKIKGVQRFYIHDDYKTPLSEQLLIPQYQTELRKIWNGDHTIPCKLTYNSSSQSLQYDAIVYPVCIYYYQRSFYLCAFGHNDSQDESNKWYNYRFDRIKKLEPLDWEKNRNIIPDFLFDKCNQANDEDLIIEDESDEKEQVETGDQKLAREVKDGIDTAYGFDFYQPAQLMLLRFNRNFHDQYIKNTWRHNTFKLVEPNKINGLLNKLGLNTSNRSLIDKRIQTHPDDAYYTMNYRIKDNSVIMRLRAWCPNVEVLYPLDLRQRMRDDMQQTWELYSEDK